jgi:hypothetical protein
LVSLLTAAKVLDGVAVFSTDVSGVGSTDRRFGALTAEKEDMCMAWLGGVLVKERADSGVEDVWVLASGRD